MLFLTGVVALNAYAVVLIVLRALVYRTALYRPMLWNIFLSILPIMILLGGFAIGALLAQLNYATAVVAWALMLLLWLLFLPNASYLITELNLSHRLEDDEERVPLWYDIILVITLAMSGVINTIINVLIVHFFVATTVFGDNAAALTRPESWVIVALVLILLGIGMYLGRYLRLNSWDLKHPPQFIRKVVRHFRDPQHLLACAGFAVTYAIFLGIIYLIIAGLAIDSIASVESALNDV